VRFLLPFELLLELGVGLLEVVEVVLEEPRLSSPLLFQLVKLSLKIDVLHLLFGYALFHGSKLLVTTHNCLFLGFLLRVRDQFCIKEEIKTCNSTTYTSRGAIISYHGKIVQLLVGLLEGSYVDVRQYRIIHQISGDDVLVPEPGHQQVTRTPWGPCGFFRRWLLGTCKARCIQYTLPGAKQLAVGG
jgi:hypothetical protein